MAIFATKSVRNPWEIFEIMATISAYLDNRKKSKTGMYKIRICVRSKNTAGYIPTNILIKEKNWHEGRIVGTTQDKQLNKMVVHEIQWNKEDVKPFIEKFETYERAWKEFEYQCDKRFSFGISPIGVKIYKQGTLI